MRVALIVDVLRMNLDDRAADATGLRVPTDPIPDLEPFSHRGSSSLEAYRSPGGAVTLLDPLPAANQRRLAKPPVYTIGHSTRTVVEFVELLRSATSSWSWTSVACRDRAPILSSTWMRCRRRLLPGKSATRRSRNWEVRGKSKTVSPEVNRFWNNQSFHNYADYALSGEFHPGLSRLLEMGQDRRCAIMCSEAVWWRCHRRIVADYLLCRGRTVFHLMGRPRLNLEAE